MRLTGAPVLVGEPDDFDDTDLARRDVDEKSLPPRLRELRGKTVTIFYLDGTTCRTELGPIAAYGWLMSPLGIPIDRNAAERQRERTIAERAMALGRKFLAADFDKEKCQSGIWATVGTPQQMRFWPAENASATLDSAALVEMRRASAYEIRQKVYEKFRFAEDARIARSRSKRLRTNDKRPGPPYPSEDPLSKGPALPTDWSDFYGTRRSWSVAGGDNLRLLVGFLRSRGQAFGFSSTMVAAFLIRDETTPTLIPLGPDDGAPEWYGFESIGAISWSTGLPLLLYSTGKGVGAFRPVGDRYVVDAKLAFGPS